MPPSTFTAIPAHPRTGKTAFLLHLAMQAAKAGEPVVFFSLLESRPRLVARIAAVLAAAPLGGVRTNADALAQAEAFLASFPLTLDDRHAWNGLDFTAHCAQLRRDSGVRRVFVDGMELITGDYSGSVSSDLRSLAHDAPDMAVYATVALPRTRSQRPPGMAALLRGSLASQGVGQDADRVVFLHREACVRADDQEWLDAHPDKVGELEVHTAKDRNGPTGIETLWLDPASLAIRADSPWRRVPG